MRGQSIGSCQVDRLVSVGFTVQDLNAAYTPRSVDADSGASLVTDRIKQDIEFDFFEAIDASVPSDFDVTAFALRGEAQE